MYVCTQKQAIKSFTYSQTRSRRLTCKCQMSQQLTITPNCIHTVAVSVCLINRIFSLSPDVKLKKKINNRKNTAQKGEKNNPDPDFLQQHGSRKKNVKFNGANVIKNYTPGSIFLTRKGSLVVKAHFFILAYLKGISTAPHAAPCLKALANLHYWRIIHTYTCGQNN